MTAYFDSGIITQWYIPEPASRAALTLRDRFSPPAVLTHLHRVELMTAWQLKVFRRELDPGSVGAAWLDLEADVAQGVWTQPVYDLSSVHVRAETLARQHAAALGTRTLDILHVAASLALRSRDFVTGNARQAALAEAAGLRVTRFQPKRSR